MLSRIKTWVAGQILKSSDLNGEFNNILNNPITLISPTTGNIDFNSNQALNFAAENLTSAASGTTPLGRIYYNVGTSSWEGIASTGAVVIGPSTAGSTGGNATGSRVKNLQGVISTNIGTFTALEYVFRTTDPYVASYVTVATSALSVNTRTTFTDAANGRDTVAALASKEVHWYAISTGPLSTQPQGIVSTRPPMLGPTLPTSYAGWCYLGASVYSTVGTGGVGSSGVTSAFNQHVQGAWTIYDGAIVVKSGHTTTAETAISLSTWVPPTADRLRILVIKAGGTTTGGSLEILHFLGVVTGRTAFGMDSNLDIIGAGGFTMRTGNAVAELPQINAAPSIFVTQSIVSGQSASMDLQIHGYRNPNGDG